MPATVEMGGRPELIFGLVGPAGTRLADLSKELTAELATFGYEVVEIRLSQLLRHFKGFTAQAGTSEFDRIRHLQEMGNALRSHAADGAALARAGVTAIREKRRNITGSPDAPAPAHAYLIHQLKHPDEVDLLRRIYGSSFFLVAGHSPRAKRVEELARRMARNENQPGQEVLFASNAHEVIQNDEKQDDDFGQNTRDTYPRADFFANLGLEGEHEVRRFLHLLFGHPFHTPSPEEYAMYQASAVSLRSSDNNRQVGAVIVNLTRDPGSTIKNADIIAVGMNEVPRGGGGFYWDKDSPDYRDQRLLQLGEDRATEIKISALTELLEKIAQKGWFQAAVAKDRPRELARLLLPELKRTQFMNIGEFSRPVHAEMAALLDGARRGVAVNGHSMYVTTFPCHNCAKHIIAAGLRRVVYLEPYPKSRAGNLYGEEIVPESVYGKEEEGKVVFCAFSGIAPRQYRQLFAIPERGGKEHSLSTWESARRSMWPRCVTPNASYAYLAAERQELDKLPCEIYTWDKDTLCPGTPSSAADNATNETPNA